MPVLPVLVERAKKNGNDAIRQFGSAPNDRMRASRVVDLLVESTSPAAQRGVKLLLRMMNQTVWYVVRGVHVSQRDPTPHITIEIDDRYHLRLDRNGCIFDITYWDGNQNVRLAGHRPWIRPGAPG
jgi:hypothetical protein